MTNIPATNAIFTVTEREGDGIERELSFSDAGPAGGPFRGGVLVGIFETADENLERGQTMEISWESAADLAQALLLAVRARKETRSR